MASANGNKRKGFASNPKGINKGGRPVGSKSKSRVKEAIARFEAKQLDAATVILALMDGDEEFFGGEVIKPSERMNAAKYVITAPEQMKKSLEDPKGDFTTKEEEEDGEDNIQPLVQLNVVPIAK